MPVSLIPKSRRCFIRSGVFASLGISPLFTNGEEKEAWYALLADTHIDADPDKIARGANMAANLRQTVQEILAEPNAPEFVLINGDCAYNTGLKEDYETLRELIQPLLAADIPIHLTMGNHDDRGPFYQLFPDAIQGSHEIKNQHLAVIETEHATWIFLDTLDVVNKVTGRLGREQLNWLSTTLDSTGSKPVLIAGHHYPQYMPEGSTETVSGIADTVAFMELLRSKPRVKGYLYGHSHSYGFKQSSHGLHLINQPPVAYLFDDSRPNGWCKATVNHAGLSLSLRCIDKNHSLHGKTTDLTW